VIKFSGEGVLCSVAVAKVLVAFASKNKTREIGVCISDGDVGATCGHTAVLFEKVDPNGTQPTKWDGSWWRRAYAEQQVKIARATKSDVLLAWQECQTGHVNLQQVIPTARSVEGTALDAKYLARLELVQAACEATAAVLVSSSEIGPSIWEVRGREHNVTVVIMPMMVERASISG
jgi:hypothetical protein